MPPLSTTKAVQAALELSWQRVRAGLMSMLELHSSRFGIGTLLFLHPVEAVLHMAAGFRECSPRSHIAVQASSLLHSVTTSVPRLSSTFSAKPLSFQAGQVNMDTMAKKRRLSPSSASSSSSTTSPRAMPTPTPKLTSFAFGFYNGAAAAGIGHGLVGDASVTAATTTNPSNAAASPTPQQPPHPPRPTHSRPGRITTRYAWLHLHKSNDSLTAASSRERVRVLWETSSSASSLKVRKRNGEILRVTARDLSPLGKEEQGREEEGSHEYVEHLDLLFDDSRAATAHQRLPLPPQIGPDLATLIYPLTTEYFLKEIWNKKALVIQGGATRLKKFCRDLGEGHASATTTAAAPAVKRGSLLSSSSPSPSFAPLTMDIPSLLEQAHRIVVWMKTKTKTQKHQLSDNGKKSSGHTTNNSSNSSSSSSSSSSSRRRREVALPEMQYLDDAPASVALACHRAGHSLYFNPPPSLQHPYIHSLSRGLGLLPLLPSSGGTGGPEGKEGDMEVFAVRPPHHTPAHWDSQHNFTIQIRGRKRWIISKSGLSEPLSNHHPSSFNHQAKEQDLALHVACGQPQDRLFPPHLSHGDVCEQARQTQGRSLPPPLLSFPPPSCSCSSSSFVLRPGAVMYVPSGWWHSVTALSDEEDGEEVLEGGGEEGEGEEEEEGGEEEEEDCLSVNMSLDPCRWRDLVTGSMGPLLWGGGGGGEGGEGWRERARVVGREGGREGGREENVVTATKRKVEGLLQELRERLARVTVEDLLPLSCFFEGEEKEEEEDDEEEEEEEGGRRTRRRKKGGKEGGNGKHVRVRVCVEAEDKEEDWKEKKERDEEEEEEERGHDLRARERGSLHARRGLSAAAGWFYEGEREGGKEGGLSHTHTPLPADAMTFVRSPLACLVESKGEGGRGRYMSISLLRGFPLDVSSAATAAAMTVRVEVPEMLRGVVERLANMPPPSSSSGSSSSSSSSSNVRALIDMVTNSKKGGREGKKEGEEEEEEEEYEVEVLVRKLVGLLTYYGFLRPWRAEGEMKKGA